MANHLGMDPVHYQKEYDEFMVKLKKFHNSKGTPFKRPPWLGGQYLDIFLLYKKVVSFGGWVKVTEDKRWKDVAECFNLPATCTNAAFALRQHYSRYLEAFERINFFGEDAEDVLVSQNARPHTPVSVGLLSGTSDYTSVISNKDPAKNFEKLILSLECGLPNEVDFAINVCMLLSNVSNSVFNLTKAPAVVEMLLAHTGVFCEESHSLKEVHKEWYQNSQRDFIKFWKETIQLKEMREYLCEPQDMNPENGDCDDESDEVLLFHPKKKIVSSRDVEAQRVFQVCMILHNFSFDVTNASVLATHPVCQRFLVMCVCSRLGCLQKIAWQTLSNLAEKMVLEAIESESTQMFFQMLHIYLVDKDRFHVLSAMDVLGKVCLLEYNDEVIESGLEVAAYEALVKVLMVPDIKLLIGSLETLYNLTGVGQVTSNYVSNVVHSIDILVCLVTLEVESFGSDVLAKVRLIENKAPVPKAVIPKPQPNQSSTLQGVPAPTAQTPTTSSANSRNEVDADTFTQNWISAFYEVNPSCSVSRIDLYADYLSCCSKLARVGILNATAFNRILKSVFPSAQLRRVQSSSQLQYAIQGICRRSNPLPVKSKLDLPDTTSTPSQQIHGSALQRGFPSSQNISVPNRTPTPPTPSQQQTWSQSGQAQNQTRPIVANLSMAHTHVVQRPASPVTVTKTYQRPSTSPALQQGQRPGFPGQATQRLQNVWKAQQSNQLQGLDLRQAQTLQTQVQPKRLTQSPHSGSLQQPVQGGNLQPQKVISQTTCNAGNLQRPTAAEQTALQRQQPQQQQQTFRQQQEQLYRQRQQQLQQMRQQMHSENQAAMLRRSSHVQTPPPVLPAQTSPRPQQVSNQAQSNRPVQPGIQQQLHGVQHVPQQTNQFVVQQAQLSIRASNGLSHSSLMPQVNTPNATATSTYRAPLVSGASNKVSQSPARTQASQQSPVVMPIHSQLPSNQKQFSPIARKPDFGQESQMQTSLGIPVNSQIQPQVRTNVQVTQAQRLLLPSPQGLTTPGQAQSREQSTMQGSLQLSVGGVPAVQQVIRVNSRQSKAQPTQNFVSCSNTPKTNSTVSGDGVVLVAREERAEDVVTSELMKEAKEARIVMVENVRLAGSEPGMIKARLESNDLKPELHEISRPVGNAINNSVSSGGLNGPAHCKEQHRGIDVPNFDSSVSVDNSNKISKNSRPTSLDTNSVGLGEVVDNTTKKEKHSNSEPYIPSPTKKPRLDTKLPSLDSDILDSPTEIRRSDSPSSLVNGDIRLDSKNRFMDKLLGKDLHLPLNGVCGIDASDLDVGISSEEDPLSSRKSSPDIFDSCNNSDFDQFLEDNALFGDVLTGDLRVDSDSSAAKTDISLEQSNSQSMQENGLRNSTSVSEATRTVNPFMDCTKSAGLPVQNSVTSDKGRIASSSENRTIAPNYKEILTNSRFDIPQQIPVNQVQRVPNTVSSNPAMYNQLNGDNVRNTPTFNSIQEPSSRVIAANAPPYFDNRTKGVATPGALVSEPSMQHGQQQSTPPSPMSPVVKSGIVASDGTSPKLTPFTSTVPSPVTETSKPYRCHWDVCLSSFDSSKQLLSHMVSEHVPVNSLLMACQWQGCTPVRRSRSSLIFHLQQKHLDPSSQSAAGTASSPALPRPKPAISQEPVQAQQAFVPQTFQFMARMLQALQADEESPLTKTVRLTAALVLRNVAQYSAVARSLLRRHERSLVQVAMSNSEASQAAAACLAELSPHRKSPEREATFSWALDS